jgi:hypothetical protein
MWSISRVDAPERLSERNLFGLVWAPRMKDLPSFGHLRETSGFVAPHDTLVMERPDGSIKMVDEARA